MDAEIKAQNSVGADVGIKATEGGILHILPSQVVWTAKGYGKQAMATAAIAALVARPTTTSMLTIYNPSSNSRHLVIERVFAHNLVGVAGSSYGIWLCSHPIGMTAPTGNNISVRNSTSGIAAGGSATIVDTAEAISNDGWFPWGDSGHAVTVTVPGGSIAPEVGGRIIVPPSAGLSIHIVADTTGATFTTGFHWFEVPTTELVVA